MNLRRLALEIIPAVMIWSLLISPPLDGLEWSLQDSLVKLNWEEERASSQALAIVDIDEESLSKLGRWPWPRDVLAQLIDKLFEQYNISHLGLDIVFPDATTKTEKLNEVIHKHNVTMAAVWSEYPFPNQHDVPAFVTCLNCDKFIQPVGWLANEGLGVNKLAGHITPIIDADGVVRRIPALVCNQNACLEALGLSLARQILSGDKKYHVDRSIFGNDTLSLNQDLNIPVSNRGELLLNWKTSGQDTLRVSASDVLNGRLANDSLAGRVIVLGSTAIGLHDQVVTPVSASYPSVLLHANVFESALSGNFVSPRSGAWMYEVSYLILTLFLIAYVFRRFNAVMGLGVGLFFGILWVFIAIYSKSQLQELAVAPISFTLMFYGVFLFIIAFFSVDKIRRETEQRFSKYLPPDAIKQLQKLPATALDQTHVRREVTVLFADLREFSRITERYSPEKFSKVVGYVMETFSEIIHHHGGAIDKYMGDGIMAFWGAPLPSSDHAEKAVLAAQAMYRSIPRLRVKTGVEALRVSIGINTGEVVVGEFGSKRRLSYTVMGPSVNLAAHLEKATRQVGLPILVGELTCSQAKAYCDLTAHNIYIASRQDTIKAYAVKVEG